MGPPCPAFSLTSSLQSAIRSLTLTGSRSIFVTPVIDPASHSFPMSPGKSLSPLATDPHLRLQPSPLFQLHWFTVCGGCLCSGKQVSQVLLSAILGDL